MSSLQDQTFQISAHTLTILTDLYSVLNPCRYLNAGKAKQSHYRPGKALRFPEIDGPRFQDNRHIMVVGLLALSTGRLYPPGNIPSTHFS